MSLFHDAHPDAEHPDRPDHDDFRLLAELIQDLDRQAEFGVSIPTLVGVDVPSLQYIAEQRLLRSLGPGFYQLPLQLKLNLFATYFDAFVLGSSYTKHRATDAETGTAGEGSSS